MPPSLVHLPFPLLIMDKKTHKETPKCFQHALLVQDIQHKIPNSGMFYSVLDP